MISLLPFSGASGHPWQSADLIQEAWWCTGIICYHQIIDCTALVMNSLVIISLINLIWFLLLHHPPIMQSIFSDTWIDLCSMSISTFLSIFRIYLYGWIILFAIGGWWVSLIIGYRSTLLSAHTFEEWEASRDGFLFFLTFVRARAVANAIHILKYSRLKINNSNYYCLFILNYCLLYSF